MAALLACPAVAVGQTQTDVTSYFVNDGRNDAVDFAPGEFAIDTGGFVPFDRYTITTATSGHYYARNYNAGSTGHPSTFHALMKRSALDLRDLDFVLTQLGLPGVLPSTGGSSPTVVIDPEIANWNTHHGPTEQLTVPLLLPCWWLCTGPAPGSGQRNILAWPYKVNGGSMMICMAADGGNIARKTEASSILLTNYEFHPSNYGTNKNRWSSFDGRFQQYDDPASGSFFRREGGRWSDGTEFLGPSAQAIEAGDIVVFVGENYSLTPWTAIQRTQEAEAFVRGEWAANPYREGEEPFDEVELDRAFLDGISYGALVSGMMALLQPKIYSGSTAWMLNDFGFTLGDHYEMQFEFDAAFGRNYWQLPTDSLWAPIHAMVDVLGIRFDNPKLSQQPWDVAAFSTNRRPGDLKVPTYGWIGDLESNFPFHWARDDASNVPNGMLSTHYFKNCEHDQFWGYVPGAHEYSIYHGTGGCQDSCRLDLHQATSEVA